MSSHLNAPTRRTVLTGGLLVAAAALVRSPRANAATPQERASGRAGSRSNNGWPVLDSFIDADVQGSGLSVPLAGGAVATILTHVARRYHYEIDGLRRGDLVGGTTRLERRTPEQTNYLSGTAVGIKPGFYPAGQTGNLFSSQRVVIDDIVAECEGVVRWGGTLTVPMEGHFQIDLPPTNTRVRDLAARFGYVDSLDSSRGAGAIDASDPARRARAKQFRRRHGR